MAGPSVGERIDALHATGQRLYLRNFLGRDYLAAYVANVDVVLEALEGPIHQDMRHALACLEGEFAGSGPSGVRALAIASLRRALLRLEGRTDE